MKKHKITTLLSLLLFFCLMSGVFVPQVVAEAEQPSQPSYEGIGMGGGGAMFNPTFDPSNGNICYTSSDMGGLYYSTDAAATWHRTETRGIVKRISVANDGTLFWGGYGLYVSHDHGKTSDMIYPQNVLATASRKGENEYLMLAEGYINGRVKV